MEISKFGGRMRPHKRLVSIDSDSATTQENVRKSLGTALNRYLRAGQIVYMKIEKAQLLDSTSGILQSESTYIKETHDMVVQVMERF